MGGAKRRFRETGGANLDKCPPPTIAGLPSKHRDLLKNTEAQWERGCARGGRTLAENDTKGDKRTRAWLNGSVPGICTPRPYQRSQQDATLPL